MLSLMLLEGQRDYRATDCNRGSKVVGGLSIRMWVVGDEGPPITGELILECC